MYTVLLSWLFLFPSPGQLIASPAQQPSTPNPADLCTLQGVVINAGTGEPLHKAIVEAWPMANRRGMDESAGTAETDATGRFEIGGLAPGRYTLRAQRNGFVSQAYGQHGPGTARTTLTLSAGQKVVDIAFRLVPAAVISGHVYDEDGEPIVSARVGAMKFVYFNGQRQLATSQICETNDLGQFRLFGLSPGQYFVQATLVHAPYDPKTRQGYLPIYYPGVPDASRAAPIEVHGGDEFPGVDITLQPVRTVAVRGRVVSIGCGGAQRAMILLISQSTVMQSGMVHDTDGQSTFELSGVSPGSYYLTGVENGEGNRCVGRQAVEVADTDVEGVGLSLTPGVEIKGRVRIEGQLDSQNGPITVSLTPRSGLLLPFSSGAFDSTKPDGSFLLKNAFDGDYEIYLSNLPDNCFVKSARMDGVDVLTAGVTIDTKQAPGSLEILVSPNGASVDGVVYKDQQPFQGATVALVPDPPHRNDGQLFKSVTTDQNGHFLLQGISPGDYKVFAWEKVEAGAYRSPEFLQPFENQGQSVHITEGSRNSVQVEMIPAK
jgi:hypothetical protein